MIIFSFFLDDKSEKEAQCCPLTGTWVTESGTYIELKHNADGTLMGKYYDLSGEPSKPVLLHGQAGSGKPTTFGFVVSLEVSATKLV